MPGGYPQQESTQTAARAARHRGVRWAAALLAVVTAACAAACAGPPAKGEVRAAPLNQSRNNVVILAREPTAQMSPQVLVTNFLQALTGDQEDPTFSVAQEFLTAGARSRWLAPGTTWSTTTKIVDYSGPTLDSGSSDHGTHPATTPATAQPAAVAPTSVGATETVTVRGTEVAEVDPFGFFKYQSASVTQQFTVKYLGAATGWRIDTPPPDFRIIKPDAFKRAYQTYQSPLPVYLPSHNDVVPQMDQVYLTQATGKVDYTYDALTRAVLHGRYPSQDTGAQLQSPVTVDANGLATVVLKAAPTGTLTVTDIQRALSETFRDASETQQLLSSTPINQVRVTYPGCTSACSPVNIAAESTLGPTVYWVCQQGQNGEAAIVSRQLPGPLNAPAVCPANGGKVQSVVGMSGVRLEKNSPIAVKQTTDSSDVKAPAATTMVAAVEHDGSVVVLNDKNSDRPVWYTANDPKKVTDLEWDPVDGSLWVVDAGGLYRVQGPGAKGATGDAQDSVAVPVGQVSRFKPSPDGLRAVVVSQQSTGGTASSSSSPTAMVTIDRSSGTPVLSADTVFQLLAGPSQSGDQQTPTLQSVTDASWADGRTVVLLGVQGSSNTPKLYKVYLDGSQDSTIIDPDDAQAAAMHITAVLTGSNGHPSLWTFSDAPGPTDPAVTNSYFKRSGGPDSFQEAGWSPVVATLTAS